MIILVLAILKTVRLIINITEVSKITLVQKPTIASVQSIEYLTVTLIKVATTTINSGIFMSRHNICDRIIFDAAISTFKLLFYQALKSMSIVTKNDKSFFTHPTIFVTGASL